MSHLRQQAAEGALAVGSRVRISRSFTEEEVGAFGQLTRDYNPVHYDRRWASIKGFDGTVCHGLLVGSMICEVGGQWGWLASGMSFRFRAPVQPGDTVTCEVAIVELDEQQRARAECTFWNQRGELVLNGELWGRLPASEEQALLRQMIDEGDPTNALADRGAGHS